MKYEIKQPLAIHSIGQRANQEDTIFPAEGQASVDDRLFMVCDGMGGHEKGEVASAIVAEQVSTYIKTVSHLDRPFSDAMLCHALDNAYNVLDAADTQDEGKKMGTTLALLYFHPGGVMAAHVGDSRYYHIRPKEGKIVYRSKDHSLVSELYEAGTISKQETRTLPTKNIIMKAIMPNQEERTMPDIVHIKDVQVDDLFYICSDGMLEQMGDDELLNVLSNADLTDDQKLEWLETATEDNRDNHSAYLIHVVGVTKDAIDENEPDDEQIARQNNKILNDTTELKALPSAEEEEGASDDEVVVVMEPEQTVSEPQYVAAPPVAPQPSHKGSNNKDKVWMCIAVVAIAAFAFLLCYIFLGDSTEEKNSTSPVYIEQPTQDPNMKQYRPSTQRKPSPSVGVNRENVHVEGQANQRVVEKEVKDAEKAASKKTPTTIGKEVQNVAGKIKSDKVEKEVKDVMESEKAKSKAKANPESKEKSSKESTPSNQEGVYNL